MPIIRVNVHRLIAERNLGSKGGQINLNSNVSLKEVERIEFNEKGKKGLRFGFGFDCSYEPDLGKIGVDGQVSYIEEGKLIDEIKESWDKDKRIPTTVMEEVINAALHKGNVQAIKIAEDIGLPSPLPMPKVAGKGGKK